MFARIECLERLGMEHVRGFRNRASAVLSRRIHHERSSTPVVFAITSTAAAASHYF